MVYKICYFHDFLDFENFDFSIKFEALKYGHTQCGIFTKIALKMVLLSYEREKYQTWF